MLHLVTDTTAYLPAELTQRFPIHIIPLKVTLGDQGIDENKVELTDFYRRLEKVETAPHTSQPAPGEFMLKYEELTRNGDEVVSIHISSGLSGTALVAEMAAQQVAPDKITVVDSRATTCVLALMIKATAEAIERGAGRDEVKALMDHMSQTFSGIFLVEDLAYLAKGGRLNGAAKFLGSVLQLHPLLYLNKGKIEGMSVARTRKRGIQQLMDETEKRVGRGPIQASVTHIQCRSDAEALAAQIRERFDCVDLFINETGPVVGAHVGPGMLGFAACPVQAA